MMHINVPVLPIPFRQWIKHFYPSSNEANADLTNYIII